MQVLDLVCLVVPINSLIFTRIMDNICSALPLVNKGFDSYFSITV